MTVIYFGRATPADVREMVYEDAQSLFADDKGDLFYYALEVCGSSHAVLVDAQRNAVVLDAEFIDAALEALAAAKRTVAINHIHERFDS